jgi:hypothetical protein
MSAIAVLKNEYPGDKAWQEFVSFFRTDWEMRPDKEIYLSTIRDHELASVLSSSMGIAAVNWYLQPVQALDNRAPNEVMENEVLGLRVLRTLLMRMPI